MILCGQFSSNSRLGLKSVCEVSLKVLELEQQEML